MLAFVLLALGCSDPVAAPPAQPAPSAAGTAPAALAIATSAWDGGGPIPARFTCEGEDLAPPLAWDGVPAGAASLALIVEDPDAPDPAAPRTTWTHWILYDLPPVAGALPEGAPALPPGTRQGNNDWGAPGYRGPCPPIGRHRYFFRLYALDAAFATPAMPERPAPDRAALRAAIEGHILAEAVLLGTYQKQAAP